MSAHHLLQALSLLFSLPLLSAIPHPQQHQETTTTNPITRFQQYLIINTAHPNPDYSSAISFLQSQSQLFNLTAHLLHFSPSKPILLLTWPGSNPSLPSILLNSHLDSVPAEPSKWLHPPFSTLWDPSSGHIYARGAQDDKCIGLQYLEAIRVLQSQFNYKPIRTIHRSYVPDEEVGGFDGMMAFVRSKEFEGLNLGFVLDEGQASVGDEYRVFYADRSPWHVVVRATGTPGHGSRMFNGGAVENLMRSVEVMSRFRENQLDLVKAGLAGYSDVVSVNPMHLKAGIPTPDGFVMNMQPSEAEAGFDIRFSPTTDPDLLKKKIADEWAPASRNMSFEVCLQKGCSSEKSGNL
ncbi:hypothetical protein RHMOL_Rhmol11G0126200 [Rhododendron molle]|uniref:Uncharacterized protein n=1 Tax=Rhododendron molle TaxID=49168 RepID=A0ACC0LRL1_RHOML|nr:hypothetical protein RHMOL_Rhmol11G0126200 [Rhododendron molle]